MSSRPCKVIITFERGQIRVGSERTKSDNKLDQKLKIRPTRNAAEEWRGLSLNLVQIVNHNL